MQKQIINVYVCTCLRVYSYWFQHVTWLVAVVDRIITPTYQREFGPKQLAGCYGGIQALDLDAAVW